ncbi:MAG: hypothetical protein ABJB98_10190 [Actinomycetota bacterium]
MRVLFVRLDAKRYGIGIRRDGRNDVGVDVPVRPGPGSAAVPHDLVHFVVEEQAGLTLGIFGQLAAGGRVGQFFQPPPEQRSQHERRRSDRLGRAGRADVARSEQLAALVDGSGQLAADADAVTGDPGLTNRIANRLSEVLAHWERVPAGQSMLMQWPLELTIRHGRLPAVRPLTHRRTGS